MTSYISNDAANNVLYCTGNRVLVQWWHCLHPRLHLANQAGRKGVGNYSSLYDFALLVRETAAMQLTRIQRTLHLELVAFEVC